MPMEDVKPEAPMAVATRAPDEVSIADFSDARGLAKWQRHVLMIHANNAGIKGAATVDALDRLLTEALHGRI